MANWDHLTNIGTHPVLDPDPFVRLPAVIEAAEFQIARHQARLDQAKAALLALNGGLEPGFYVVFGESDVRPIQLGSEGNQEDAAARLAALFPYFNYFEVA